VYKFFKKVDITILFRNLNYVDSFVLLTEKMKEVLDIGERPYVVVEGIVDTTTMFKDVEVGFEEEHRIPFILYTGTLNKKYGIEVLLHAFTKLTNENINLIICGKGDSEGLVKQFSRRDYRIKYLGQVKNEDIEKLQRNATILVNPRQNNEIFTKYSFPSKNMEYLLSGRPVVAYKLDGIPDDYDRYFFYVEKNTSDNLVETIDQVLQLSEKERIDFGRGAREYVLREKNCQKAGSKIIDMIRKARNDNSSINRHPNRKKRNAAF